MALCFFLLLFINSICIIILPIVIWRKQMKCVQAPPCFINFKSCYFISPFVCVCVYAVCVCVCAYPILFHQCPLELPISELCSRDESVIIEFVTLINNWLGEPFFVAMPINMLRKYQSIIIKLLYIIVIIMGSG